jgi:23S rRNA (uridine2552-2'-O)-methyltransferase
LSSGGGSWFHRQAQDHFVKEARRLDYRSRAAFKLLQLNEVHHLLRKGDLVLDLGAAPGGWSQVASKIVAPKGSVLAIDLLPMTPIDIVKFIQGDFSLPSIQAKMQESMPEASVILSDAAPNLTGISAIDMEACLELNKSIIEMARGPFLKKNGHLLFKTFRSPSTTGLLKNLQGTFRSVQLFKPEASRKDSAEIYLVAQRKLV